MILTWLLLLWPDWHVLGTTVAGTDVMAMVAGLLPWGTCAAFWYLVFAYRLVLELKGKLAGNAFAPAGGAASAAQADILSALMALGYSEREAQASVRALPAEVTVSEGIRLALKALAR